MSDSWFEPPLTNKARHPANVSDRKEDPSESLAQPPSPRSAGLSDEVRKLIAHMRERPELYPDATLPLLQSTNKQALSYEALAAARAHPETLSTATDGSPYAVSEYERVMYYHAEGGPVLLYRSDLHTRPYALPPAPPPPRCSTLSGALGPALRAAKNEMLELEMLTRIRDKWGITVCNAIIMFYEEGTGDGASEAGEGAAEPPNERPRPIVMVHVHPGGVTAAQATHDASEEILDLFEKHGVPRGRLTVEWGEQYVREIIADMRERPNWYCTATLPLLQSTNKQALSYEALTAARAHPEALSTTTDDNSPYSISEYERIIPFAKRHTAMHGLWNDSEDLRAMRRKLGERGIREEILALLEAQGVPRGDVTVEWKEGHVRRWGLGENYVELEERSSEIR
ncbi:hypothetical protein EV714DRAFT_288005 [Schizophyllum commune]